MENYYTISHDNNIKTPYAPTIINSGEAFLSKCPKCDRTRYNYANRELSLLVEGKGKLPDYLMCGHYPLMIVSDRVLTIWEKEGVTGYTSYPVVLVDQQMEEIINAQYYNIIISGRAELDFTKMGVKIKKVCSKCGAVEYNKETWEFGEAIMKESTYDKSDIFTYQFFEASPACTKKVLEIVYRNKLTGFRFKELKLKFAYGAPKIDLKGLFGTKD